MVVMGDAEVNVDVDTDKEVETGVDGDEEVEFSSISRVAFLKETLLKDGDNQNVKDLNILLPAPRPS